MDKFKELINSPIPTLINFYATWCEPCRMMQPIIEDLKRLVGNSVHIVRINIDAPGNRKLISMLDISHVPTIIIFKNGEAVWRQSGMTHAETLKGILEKV